jgi:hypothetical protein
MTPDQPSLFDIPDPYRDGDTPLAAWTDKQIELLLAVWKKNIQNNP